MAITQLFTREERIKIWMGWALCITALCVDLVEVGLNWLGAIFITDFITTPVAGFVFWVWLAMLGVNGGGSTKNMGRKYAVQFGTVLLELMPGLDVIPFLSFVWTIGMILTVVMTRMEDNNERATITGALQKITRIGQMDPALPIADKVMRRAARTLRTFERKPQK